VNTAFSPLQHSVPNPGSFRLLTEAERKASLEESLSGWQPGQDIWVYGYGSLIWRPEFDFSEKRTALLHGYHRALCLWSRVNRGTPDQPGLVFGLDVGGSCRGMAFRIPAARVPQDMEALWRREMPSGAYLPRWLTCRTERLIHIVRNAHGSYGPCMEYVLETAQALKQSNIHDKRLQALVNRLRRETGGEPR
jgi:cation transport protein ChaC